MQDRQQHIGLELTLAQKVAAFIVLGIAVALAAVLGLMVLYVAAVAIAFAVIAVAFMMIRQRFFAPRGRRRRSVVIRRTGEDVIIDVEPNEVKRDG